MDIFGANTSTYGCAEFYIASEPPFLRMFGTLMTWWNLIFIDAKKSADILQLTECRLAFSNSCPLFLVPWSVFFQVHADPHICSFCITAFPTLKKVRHVTVLTYRKANWLPSKSVYGFISACSIQHRQLQLSRPTHWHFPDCVVSSFLKPKSAQKFQIAEK